MATLVNLVLACGVALMGVSSASAQDSPDFYKGKTVSLYVGSTTGGVYDVYARLLARHMGQHIPGNPKILSLNMDGAGGLMLRTSFTMPRLRTAHRPTCGENKSDAQMRNSEE
jgi:tripartite-type tricarboxylate transporter receptor subunit TctC